MISLDFDKSVTIISRRVLKIAGVENSTARVRFLVISGEVASKKNASLDTLEEINIHDVAHNILMIGFKDF